jgi:hypothetical protein
MQSNEAVFREHQTAATELEHDNGRFSKLPDGLESTIAFIIVVESSQAVRNHISSYLYASLSKEQWNRVLVIAPHQIHSAVRWIENELERGAADKTSGTSTAT